MAPHSSTLVWKIPWTDTLSLKTFLRTFQSIWAHSALATWMPGLVPCNTRCTSLHHISVSRLALLPTGQVDPSLVALTHRDNYSFVVQLVSCVQLCSPMDCSMPGFSVLLYLPEIVLKLIHWVDDAIQPTHSLPPPSLLAFNLSKHQGLFQWVSSSYLAKVLKLQLQSQFFNEYSGLISFRID